MKKNDFKDVPFVENWRTPIEPFTSLVIIPTTRKHDSGWKCIEFVACKDNEPVIKFGGCSDVIHIDGIGGYGKEKNFTGRKVETKGWTMDCLPCGYLHLWCNKTLEVGNVLSDCEIYGTTSRTK